jgi:HK97 family phage prohead protease
MGNQPDRACDSRVCDPKENKPVSNASTESGAAEESSRHTVLTAEQGAEIKRLIASAGPKRRFRFHMKLVESDKGRRRIEGYASTRDIDRTGEIVEPGAFADSLKDFMKNPVLTYMHDWSNPIGKIIDARIDEVGLFIRAEISETAQRIWKLIEEGILRALSIGYEVVEEKLVEGLNHILKLRLYEVAVVSIPANRRALFSVSKALEAGDDLLSGNPGDDAQGETHQPPPIAEPSTEAGFSDAELTEAHSILKEVMATLNPEATSREDA